MRPSQSLALSCLLAAHASAHGVVTMIKGANGVDMPVADGTPRDCSSNRCGSQADTAIIRDREIQSGDVGPLGRTQGNGPIDAATMVQNFMGAATAPTNNGANSSVGVEDTIGNGAGAANDKREESASSSSLFSPRQLLKGLAGLLGGGGGAGAGTKSTVATETNVAATAGAGASSGGLPTCADDGTIKMVFHQINQDGAGPLEAAVDPTSGGTQASVFQTAEVTQDVPGVGFQGLSLATNTDFPLKVQMPAGMTCDGTIAGVQNVCVVRVRNGAAAGPFGGSAAFTQSPAARKRAIEYRLRKRMAKALKA
ncbi:putative cell surface protein [Diplogelasinospora grovesii]|uniref:Cell surface protein n=1 Tax=Diplogelasinospora grovesii TaxID=303347 RepID=A0AAN6N5G8_9PEZI|nr:putative cell surface protein [Diplogelasinospora grovesii]